MRVLFLTVSTIESIEDRGIYTDLLRKFRTEGHEIYVVNPIERREKKKTFITNTENVKILSVKTLNLQKSNPIEKGLGIMLLESQYLYAIKKYYKNIKFDLILYSTPPITLNKVISFIKQRDKCFSYLLLKDIFPQNAVDLKLMKENGFLHRYFRRLERRLYQLSDTIGCMSQANVQYIKSNNPFLSLEKIEVNPNSIEPRFPANLKFEEKKDVLKKYRIPDDKKIFIYGGNLGKPQGVDFLLETIVNTNNENVFFLIVGDGTEYSRISTWFKLIKPPNAIVLNKLSKIAFDELLLACDVGMIFLNRNFTIPNFPSRLLSYLEVGIPVIAATDCNSDIGLEIANHQCGYGIESGDLGAMICVINELITQDLSKYRKFSHKWLNDDFHVSQSYELIIDKMCPSQFQVN